MTPLDDELRSLLHSRADALSPAPDPLSGIERRAKRMRRNRVAASVAGSALVVAAIAIAVPSMLPDRGGPDTVATTPTPSPASTPAPARSYGPNELDPEHPWAYRGPAELVKGTELASLQAEWRAIHPGSPLTPIFGQVHEPSNRPEIAFVSTEPERWGVATSSEAGWDFVVDEALPEPSTALMTVLAGDEAPRLLVIAGPATGDLSYAKDGVSFHTLVGPQPGIAFAPLEGDTTRDAIRVLDGNGDIDNPVFEGPAPDPAGTIDPASRVRPPNYIAWPARGTIDPRVEAQAVRAFAQALGVRTADVGHHALYGGATGGGGGFVFMQAWVGTDDAHAFGFATDGNGKDEPFLGPVTAADPPLLAYLLSASGTQTTDTLLLIPRPGAGGVRYAPDATAPYRQVASGRSDLTPIGVVERDPRATSDRVQVLDGDGMKVLYDGAVQPLLCGARECG